MYIDDLIMTLEYFKKTMLKTKKVKLNKDKTLSIEDLTKLKILDVTTISNIHKKELYSKYEDKMLEFELKELSRHSNFFKILVKNSLLKLIPYPDKFETECMRIMEPERYKENINIDLKMKNKNPDGVPTADGNEQKKKFERYNGFLNIFNKEKDDMFIGAFNGEIVKINGLDSEKNLKLEINIPKQIMGSIGFIPSKLFTSVNEDGRKPKDSIVSLNLREGPHYKQINSRNGLSVISIARG